MSDKGKELDTKINGIVADLMDRLSKGDTGSFAEYLAFCRRFHKYSLGNQMLVWCQKPDATFVAGFKAWLKMGNPVRRGEHGMKILVPFRGKHEVVNRHGQAEMREYLTFGPGTVFDISQTEHPEMVPEMFVPLGGNTAELRNQVMKAVVADNIIVEYEECGTAAGVSHGGRIGLNQNASTTNQITTLLHEWAHEIHRRQTDRWKEDNRGKKEMVAEGCAFIVSSWLGIEVPYSADYILHWGATVEDFRGTLTLIMQDCKYMIERIEKQAGTELEEVA